MGPTSASVSPTSKQYYKLMNPRHPGEYRNWGFHGVKGWYIFGVHLPSHPAGVWTSRETKRDGWLVLQPIFGVNGLMKADESGWFMYGACSFRGFLRARKKYVSFPDFSIATRNIVIEEKATWNPQNDWSPSKKGDLTLTLHIIIGNYHGQVLWL